MKSTDTIKAKLTPREAVLNRNAAELLGRDTIKRLNDHGNMLAKRGVDLASDSTPGPSTENLMGYDMGTADVRRDDRGDLMRDADATFYGGGQAPQPTPTPTPVRGYAYGTDDVRRKGMRTTDRYYRGININARPSRNAITDTSQGQIIQGSGGGAGFGIGAAGGGGYGPGQGSLPPDQNPAYQAAIAKGRPSRGGYTMIQTPSGGTMAVPIGQERKYTDLLFKGNPTADTGFQRPSAADAYALGNTGAVPTGNSAYARSFRLGSNIENPVQPPQSSFGYQAGQFAANAAPGILPAVQNAASRVASAVGNFFGGGKTQASQYGQNVSTGRGSAASIPMTVPPGIGASVPPPVLTGPAPNEQMFPTGVGGAQPFPSANPAQGTVRMANEAFPGNVPVANGTPYPTAIAQPVNQPFNTQRDQDLVGYQRGTADVMPRRYSDYY